MSRLHADTTESGLQAAGLPIRGSPISITVVRGVTAPAKTRVHGPAATLAYVGAFPRGLSMSSAAATMRVNAPTRCTFTGHIWGR